MLEIYNAKISRIFLCAKVLSAKVSGFKVFIFSIGETVTLAKITVTP